MMTERFCICILCVSSLSCLARLQSIRIPFSCRTSNTWSVSTLSPTIYGTPIKFAQSREILPDPYESFHPFVFNTVYWSVFSFVQNMGYGPLRFVTIRLTNLLSSSFNYSYSSEQSVTVTIIYKSLDLIWNKKNPNLDSEDDPPSSRGHLICCLLFWCWMSRTRFRKRYAHPSQEFGRV